MASTPTQTPTPTPTPTVPIKTAARKLPVKRKSPDYSPNPNPNLIPKIETPDGDDDEEEEEEVGDFKSQPPFKFHRIWTESDEIRFLQGLVDSSTDGLIFPRDLPFFYNRFSESTPQPYTKSQLSEKLRRLRKKFHVISARISRGLDVSLLSAHDRSLFELSKQLWHPSFSSSSPFNTNNNKRKPTSVRVKVSFSPTFAPSLPALPPPPPPPTHSLIDDQDNYAVDNGVDIEINNDNVDVGQGEELDLLSGGGLGRIAGKTVLDVFDKSLKEVRMVLVRRGLLYPDDRSTSTLSPCSKLGKAADLLKRHREQRVSELDVLSRRLRLVLEDAVHDQ